MMFKMNDKEQIIKIYNLRADTNEFIGEGDAYIPPHTGIPANSTEIAPPETENGLIPVFDIKNQQWSVIEDHRGLTVYSTATGDAIFIADLGVLPVGVTTIAPPGAFQIWDGENWVKDENAERDALINNADAKKRTLMEDANKAIAPLQDAADLYIETDEESASLLAWKKYRVLLNRVDVSVAPEIEWPDKPATA